MSCLISAWHFQPNKGGRELCMRADSYSLSCETWVLYKRHLITLEYLHKLGLTHFLKVVSTINNPGTQVSKAFDVLGIELMAHYYRL